MWGDIAIAFSIAFVTAFMGTPYTIKLARKLGAVDTPKDKRRINKVTMPRLGGLAVIAGFVVSVIYLLIVMSIEKNINLMEDNYYLKLLGFLLGGTIIGVTCFRDDVKGVSALGKLIAQILAASVVIISGIRIEHLQILNFTITSEVVLTLISLGWIVGVTNAINLIDGLDGLSTGISIISCLSLLIIFALNGSPLISILLVTALAGSLVGFLPYNFNPAKTFIGDTGSNFLGFCLSIISILGVAKTYTAVVIVLPLIVLALPVYDTVFAIFRRMIKGKSVKAIMKPDANHLHHKMLKMGFSQKQAVLCLYAISAAFGMFAVILLEDGIWKALSFGIIIIVIIAVCYKDFFKDKLVSNEYAEVVGSEPEEDEKKVKKVEKTKKNKKKKSKQS